MYLLCNLLTCFSRRSAAYRKYNMRYAYYPAAGGTAGKRFEFEALAIPVLKPYDHNFRDVAQPGSALRSGRRGRWFESSHPDHLRSY